MFLFGENLLDYQKQFPFHLCLLKEKILEYSWTILLHRVLAPYLGFYNKTMLNIHLSIPNNYINLLLT